MRRLAVVLSASGMFGACVAGPPGPPGPTGPAGPAAEVFAFTCPPDSVRSGTSCIDKYEASVWFTTDAAVIAKIQDGRVALADLTAAAAKQFGFVPDDYGTGCPDTAAGCMDFYAVSIAGVPPSRFMTRYQAVAFARNANKRLPTNQAGKAAALGTPDPGASAAGSADCNTANGGGGGVHVAVPTGSRSACVSDVGAFDMVGNVDEWVAEWVPRSTGQCMTPIYGTGDLNCLVGASTILADVGPGVIMRGGAFYQGVDAGVFTVTGGNAPPAKVWSFGFRAAR